MKSTLLKALLLPIALLALGSINHASAATCDSSYTMAAITSPSFSCSLNFLMFSNFSYVPSSGLTAGCGGAGDPACPPVPVLPNPIMDIAVHFDVLTSGEDEFTTLASTSSPITQLIVDYSAGNSVNEFQTEMGILRYMVTGIGGATITEVDAGITGLATQGATGELNNDLCVGTQFGSDGSCVATEDIAAEALALTFPAGQQGDGSPDWESSIMISSAGVYSEWDLSGGNTDPTSTANVTAFENDFINTAGIPEPGTFALLGGGLVALGAFRRRKKTV
jgi:PEP-CTERM motif